MLLTRVAEKLYLNVNSDFKITYKSGDDLLEVSDDDDASEFVNYVVNNPNIKVTLFVVNSIGSDGIASATDSNQLGSVAPPLHTPHTFQQYHTQGIDVQTGDQFQKNSQYHYGHDTYDYQNSQYHYGHDTYDYQNSQPFDFPTYDYSLDEDVEYIYGHDQQNDFQNSEYHHEQTQQNDFQDSQPFDLTTYDYSLDEDVEYISTNDSDERFLSQNYCTDWYSKPSNHQDLSDEEKSSESSESSDDEHNPLLNVSEDVFWNMPPIPPTPAPFKAPKKPLRYNPSELVKLRDIFDNKEKLKVALGLKCVKEGFQIKVKRSSKTRFEAECKFGKCEWFLLATKIKNLESFLFKKFTDRHSCPKTQIHSNHSQANKKVLTSLIK